MRGLIGLREIIILRPVIESGRRRVQPEFIGKRKISSRFRFVVRVKEEDPTQ